MYYNFNLRTPKQEHRRYLDADDFIMDDDDDEDEGDQFSIPDEEEDFNEDDDVTIGLNEENEDIGEEVEDNRIWCICQKVCILINKLYSNIYLEIRRRYGGV